MNPIPLAAPDGQVYAYACSHCRHVCAGTSLMCPPQRESPHPALVEHSHEEAESCCVCRECGGVIELDTWGINCLACERWTRFCRIFINIIVAIDNRIGTAEAWSKRYDDDDDDDDSEEPYVEEPL